MPEPGDLRLACNHTVNVYPTRMWSEAWVVRFGYVFGLLNYEIGKGDEETNFEAMVW